MYVSSKSLQLLASGLLSSVLIPKGKGLADLPMPVLQHHGVPSHQLMGCSLALLVGADRATAQNAANVAAVRLHR